MLQPDDKVGGYELLELLGSGAAGEVWRARREGNIFALKLLRVPPNSENNLEALWTQAQACAALPPHPNLVSWSEVSRQTVGTQDLLCLVSEYQTGGTLQDWLAHRAEVAPGVAVSLTAGILQGLAALHHNSLRHGNLHPANVFLHQGQPRLADFGLGRLTRSLGPLVTPDYLAPEAWDGEWTEATDIWAAGVMLYQMLSGRLPFQHPSRRATMRALLTQETPPLPVHVPGDLRTVVARALHKEPSRRWATADDMRQALASALPPESPAEVEQLRAKVVQLEAEIASLRRPVPVMPVAAPSVPSGSVAFLGADLGSLRQVEPLGVRQRLSALAQSFTASRATFVKVLLVVLCAGVVGFASMRAYLPSAPAASQPPAPAQTQTQTEKAAALPATAPAAVASNPPEVETQPVPGGEVRLVRMTGQSSPSGRAGHFYLGETEVTRRLWQAVAQLPAVRQELPPEPWRKGRRVGPEGPDCSACPATAVSWQATQEFIARLNALPGNRFTWRLPTAAEWVAACGECRLQEDSNIRMTGDGPAFVRPVKSGSANEFGLYDMYGNVWEWCQDQAAHDAERREIRGGSFRRQDAWANTEEDYEGYPDGGFRLAATR